jgi:hypothetical protein
MNGECWVEFDFGELWEASSLRLPYAGHEPPLEVALSSAEDPDSWSGTMTLEEEGLMAGLFRRSK